MFRKLHINKHQVALWFRHGDFRKLLGPGAHWVYDGPFSGAAIELFDKLDTKFAHERLDVLVSEPAVAGQLHVVDLTDEQRALVWKDGRLGWILGPGRHAFWKRPADVKIEIFETSALLFAHPKIDAILGHPGGAKFLDGVRVESHETALLFHEGKLIKRLDPGMYVYWRGHGRVTWKAVDLREQTLDVAGQEIMTADKVTLRINALLTYRVKDAELAVTAVKDHEQALYREVQMSLRAAIGTRTLEKLLTDKDAVGDELRDTVANRAAAFGVQVDAVGLRDVILPGDMKLILNQVIEAQKQSEANLIKRREETAAARSQANTAKLLADNPVLAKMKELEALQEILKGAKVNFVLGQTDLTRQLQQLVATPDKDA